MRLVEVLAGTLDALAVLVLLTGLVGSVQATVRTARGRGEHFLDIVTGEMLRTFRITLGRWILVALDILIVSDILHSIAHRTLEEVTLLAGIVGIRVALSYFLDHEVQQIEARQLGLGRGSVS
ncbi:DUF1622 domain-containing protein [Ruegeria hyattellae]|uniref:DUF1622 domain-containing protein n=1 Tax=Ruegeria hyattellae TaxID=3233337 RepID=UPI00355B7F0B